MGAETDVAAGAATGAAAVTGAGAGATADAFAAAGAPAGALGEMGTVITAVASDKSNAFGISAATISPAM